MAEAMYDGDFLPRHLEIGWGTDPWQRTSALPEFELGVRVVLATDEESPGWTDDMMRYGAVVQRAHEAEVGSLHRRIRQLEDRWVA